MTRTGYNQPVTRCCFCANRDFRFHSEATYWKEFDLHFVECTGCGLIFSNPMPDIDTVKRGNEALNIHHESRGTLPQYRGGKEFSRVLRRIKPAGILLDVGCAEGFFLRGIEDHSDWKAEGVEIIDSVVAFARERLGLTVHSGTLETLKNSAERYDFIRMNNVIEHVQDPVQFLRTAHALLKKGGQVYCSTPNGIQDGSVLKTANKRGFKINLLENHFFYYPPKTLADMYGTCGFRILKHSCEDTSHSLNDFGYMPWFKHSRDTQEHRLSAFLHKTNEEFVITDDEIRSFRNDRSLRPWRLAADRWVKKLFRLRLPATIGIGHQQNLLAEKL